MRSSTLLACLPLVLSLGMGVLAQVEMAECLAGWEWNRNSLDQDPCTIGSMLDANCRDLAKYNYERLEPDEYYVAPSKNHTGDMECDCNTVMYSLIMACTTCQGGIHYSWDGWSRDCEGVYITQYPFDIPYGTAVPHWAFINVTALISGTYSDSRARTVGRDPEALPRQLNTKTTSEGPNATGAVGGNTSSDGPNVGAIAGGVIGGVVALVIIALAVFFIVRHNRKKRAQSSQPHHQYQDTTGDSWKSSPNSPTSPTYDSSILYGTTVVPSVPFQQNNPGDSLAFPPPAATHQTNLAPIRRPVTYVTPITNYPDRR